MAGAVLGWASSIRWYREENLFTSSLTSSPSPYTETNLIQYNSSTVRTESIQDKEEDKEERRGDDILDDITSFNFLLFRDGIT